MKKGSRISAKERTSKVWDISTALRIVYTLACVLITASAWGDLWFDEIWSLTITHEAKTFGEIFTGFHHDNNHLLNTFFLKLMGDQQPPIVYRLLSVCSGFGSVVVVGHLAKKWGDRAALISVLLTSTSYPLVLYFSEARGYSPAIFFALLSYLTLLETLRHFKLSSIFFFWISNIFGVLAHLTFLTLTASTLIFTVAREFCTEGHPIRKIMRLSVLYLPPSIFVGWFFQSFVRDMVVGGGPKYSIWSVVGETLTLLLGFPETPPSVALAVGCVLGVIIAGTYALYRSRDEQWLFYPLILLVSPILMLVITRPQFLHFRYFIVCFPFFYLLLGRVLAHWYSIWPIQRRPLITVALLLLIAGQIHGIFGLLVYGRGGYSAALARIAASTTQSSVRIGSTHDFQNRLLVEFYSASNSNLRKLQYVEQADWQIAIPDWLITHSQHSAYQPPPVIDVEQIGTYGFVDTYGFSGISGWNWFLYRREAQNR